MRFFLSQTQIDKAETFPMFGWEHLVLLMMMALALVLSLWDIAHAPRERAEKITKAAAIAVPLLEASHTVWLFTCGYTNPIKLLPLHLCAMQSIFIPLAVFTRKRCFQEFIYATSVLGGIFGILFPTGVAECYPIWHYQTLQTAMLHGLLIFVPLALIYSRQFRPDFRNFPKVLFLFLCVALVAAAVDFGFGENYMFLREAPEGTPLAWVFDTFGRMGYLIVTFLLLAGISMSLYLPFRRRGERKVAQEAAERR